MKKIALLLVLSISITGNLCAQLSLRKRPVKMEEMANFRQAYFIDLKASNSMRIDVYAPRGTAFTYNVDSLMNILEQTVATIADSLPSEFDARTITVSTYDTLARTINWRSAPATERQLMLQRTRTMETKITQDTIILNVYTFSGPGKNDPPFLRISFYLNNLHQLGRFNTQNFNGRLQSLEPENNTKWSTSKEGWLYLKADPSIRILKQANPQEWRSAFTADVSISAQNYRDRFAPSINAGVAIVRTRRTMQVEYWLGCEYNFTFGRNASGEASTFVNEFVTVSYKTFRRPEVYHKVLTIFPNIKLGWLYRRRDPIYAKNTFKIGIGQFNFGNPKLRVEPTFYFHDLLRGVSPSFRITQSF